MRSITARVENCIVPTKTGRPSSPWAISAPSTAAIDAVGAVVGLGDHRREGRAQEGQVHLVADLLQAVLDDGEGDGIDASSPQPPTATMRLPSRVLTSTRLPGSMTVVASICSTIAGPANVASERQLLAP